MLLNFEHLRPYMGISLPNEIWICNARLWSVLVLGRCIVLSYVIYAVVNGAVWYNSVPFTGIVSGWVEGASTAHASKTETYTELCNTSLNTKFTYQYDPQGIWMYDNFSCISLMLEERYFKDGTDIFVTTYFIDTLVDTVANTPLAADSDCTQECSAMGACPDAFLSSPNSSKQYVPSGESFNELGECLCECRITASRFVAGVETNSVLFEHSGMVLGGEAGISEEISDALTIIQDASGSIPPSFPRQSAVALSIEQYLKLAKWSLNSPNEQTNENMLQGNFETFPLSRITGLQLTVNLEYRNTGRDSPTCYVTIGAKPAWTSRVVIDYPVPKDIRGQGRMHSRYNYGIRFHFQPQGSWYYDDLVKLLTYLASVIIYMQVPTFIVMLISRYALGTLSSIYYQAQVKTLDVNSIFCGVLCRALQGQLAYRTFSGHSQAERLGNGNLRSGTENWLQPTKPQQISEGEPLQQADQELVTNAQFEEEIRRLFLDEDRLQPAEVQAVTMLILEGLNQDVNGISRPGHVDRSKFINTCTNDETCRVSDLVNLFDLDRKRHCIERIFDDRSYMRHSGSSGKLNGPADGAPTVKDARAPEVPAVSEECLGADDAPPLPRRSPVNGFAQPGGAPEEDQAVPPKVGSSVSSCSKRGPRIVSIAPGQVPLIIMQPGSAQRRGPAPEEVGSLASIPIYRDEPLAAASVAVLVPEMGPNTAHRIAAAPPVVQGPLPSTPGPPNPFQAVLRNPPQSHCTPPGSFLSPEGSSDKSAPAGWRL
jgi:hypothetical protein